MLTDTSTYAQQLQTAFQKAGRFRAFQTIGRLLSRLIEFYFLMVVVSMFIAVLTTFVTQVADPSIFFTVIRYFMLSVLAFVLFAIVRKQVKKYLTERKSILADSGFQINIITIVIAAAIYYLGYLVGNSYLGEEMSIDFLVRWCFAIGSVIVLITPYYALKRSEIAFTRRYKKALIETALPHISADARYEPNAYIDYTVFQKSYLYTCGQIIKYQGGDQISRGNAQFRSCNLRVMHKIESHFSGKNEVNYEQLFNGYFIVMEFNRTFEGLTVVLPDEAHTVVGSVYGEMLNALAAREGTTMAFMEDPQFEQNFVVYTSNQQEARYILTPKIIERIKELKTHFTDDVTISFVANHMYVGIKCENDLFQPPLFGPMYNAELVEKQTDRLAAIVTLPELFDLERKIWGL